MENTNTEIKEPSGNHDTFQYFLVRVVEQLGDYESAQTNAADGRCDGEIQSR